MHRILDARGVTNTFRNCTCINSRRSRQRRRHAPGLRIRLFTHAQPSAFIALTRLQQTRKTFRLAKGVRALQQLDEGTRA